MEQKTGSRRPAKEGVAIKGDMQEEGKEFRQGRHAAEKVWKAGEVYVQSSR